MSELEVIRVALEQAARRRRLVRALQGLWQGLLVGACATLLLLAAYHVFPLPLSTLNIAPFVPLPFCLLGLVIGGWRRSTLPALARWVDQREQLKERLSTALEVAQTAQPGEWRDLVVSDAAQHAQNIDARQMLPLGLPKSIRWSVLVLALCAGLGFVPEYRSKTYAQKKADEQVIKEVGKKLAELTRQELEKRPPLLPPTQKALESVAKLGDELANKAATRSEALKDLANASEKLKEQLKELGKDPALKRLEQAARNPGGGDTKAGASLQKQVEALQKQLGSPTGDPEALDKVKKQLEKLQDAARGLADNSSASSAEDKKKLGESLSALSRQVQDLGLQVPELDDAVKALAANQTDLVLKDLQAATTDLEKMRDAAKSLQQLQQQVEKMGKDLAEQLKFGQPEAAAQTLQKMADQLKAANLSAEQMETLKQEVAKAIAPAANYGQVSEHLKQADDQMQKGNKGQAAQSLAAAAKELQELAQQMADAQQLQEALAACEKASQCVGSCQGWAKCNKPGYKPGGKPGVGVGNWADENANWDGQSTAGWDNSSVKRPDQDARGQTDRGDGDLNPALTPTKVKGQFSPGGQMPSITLKGVSIKGISKVDYEAAAATAQSDAQAALSQEKVPRAYQGPVKDYFDDLKK